MTAYSIRKAVSHDLPEIIQLCGEHAEFEQAVYSPVGRAEQLQIHLFGAVPSAYCLVVEIENTLAGYATYSKEFSTWDAGFYIHMDCLFLRPAARNQGIGEELINTIASDARKLGCSLIQWQTPNFNTRAIKFYKRLGAVKKEKVRFYLNTEKQEN